MRMPLAAITVSERAPGLLTRQVAHSLAHARLWNSQDNVEPHGAPLAQRHGAKERKSQTPRREGNHRTPKMGVKDSHGGDIGANGGKEGISTQDGGHLLAFQHWLCGPDVEDACRMEHQAAGRVPRGPHQVQADIPRRSSHAGIDMNEGHVQAVENFRPEGLARPEGSMQMKSRREGTVQAAAKGEPCSGRSRAGTP